VQALYSNLDIDFALPRPDPDKQDGKGSIDGDDVKPAFTLGAMYEPSDGTRFGLFYQSEVKIKFDGDLKAKYSDFNVGDNIELARNVASDTDLTLAEYVRFGVHQDMDERWGVDFTVGWDNWSALSNVLVSTQDSSAGIPTRWKDTYHYAWGTQYKLDEYWDLTAGIAYDTNPVSSQNRNAQLPVDKQIRYAAGARYKLSDSLTVGGYVNYMDLGSAQLASKRFGGKFDYNNATQLIANMTWRF
jgi:long-chain fatty acid transport protein